MKKLLLLLIIPFLSFGQTPCLDAVANATGLMGEFIPQCDDDGSCLFPGDECVLLIDLNNNVLE